MPSAAEAEHPAGHAAGVRALIAAGGGKALDAGTQRLNAALESRARQINDYYADLHEGSLFDSVGPLVDASVDDKPLSVALHEINEDKLILKPIAE